ncbi:hypothetical protein CHELA41_40289 [Hyphomicrobiales bacterium]|nr:hypothetical protein CHELA41_40289 [Hyphomicrobiales bacterium]
MRAISIPGHNPAILVQMPSKLGFEASTFIIDEHPRRGLHMKHATLRSTRSDHLKLPSVSERGHDWASLGASES